MLKNLKYNQLQQLGIKVWQARETVPMSVPQTIRINARCLIMLHNHLEHKDYSLSPAAQKILHGMISVLELPVHEQMLAIVNVKTPEINLLQTKIAAWNPLYVLQLSMDLPEIITGKCLRTYCPEYLAANPQHKGQAYKLLLTLRSMLHGAT